MTTTPPTPNRADRTQHHLQTLAELSDLAMALTRAAAARALADLSEPPTAHSDDEAKPKDHALTFARLSRAVRQTIALEARLLAHRDAPQTRGLRLHGHSAASNNARARVANAVHTAARADADAPRRLGASRHAIARHIDERLEADDTAAALEAGAPIAAIAAQICQDLGIPYTIEIQPDQDLEPQPAKPPPPRYRPKGPSPRHGIITLPGRTSKTPPAAQRWLGQGDHHERHAIRQDQHTDLRDGREVPLRR